MGDTRARQLAISDKIDDDEIMQLKNNMHKRKLPDSVAEAVAAAASSATATDLVQTQPAKKPAQILPGSEEMVTPPRRVAPKGSPADVFVQKSPTRTTDTTVSSHNAYDICPM